MVPKKHPSFSKCNCRYVNAVWKANSSMGIQSKAVWGMHVQRKVSHMVQQVVVGRVGKHKVKASKDLKFLVAMES